MNGQVSKPPDQIWLQLPVLILFAHRTVAILGLGHSIGFFLFNLSEALVVMFSCVQQSESFSVAVLLEHLHPVKHVMEVLRMP